MQVKTGRRAVLWGGLAFVAVAALAAFMGWDVVRLAWWTAIQAAQDGQRLLHRELTAALQAVADHRPLAAMNLIGLGFLYGVLHAAGPGHGKVVISAYLATHESRIGRGLGLTALASLLQGVTAVIAVEVAVRLLDLGFRGARGSLEDLETASYALVVTVGLGLAASAGYRLIARRGGAHGGCHGHDHHGHAHAHAHAHLPVPDSDAAGGKRDWLHGAGVVLSVGLRPCTGAVLVLALAHALQMTLAGMAAVLAMSAGTAMTVSMLALLAIHGRRFAIRLAAADRGISFRVEVGLHLAALAGGLLIASLGGVLLTAALTAARHPLM